MFENRRLHLRLIRCNGRVRGMSAMKGVKKERALLRPACLDQCFSFGPEPRFSGEMPQSGRISAMECAIKAGLRRRSSRRVNMMATRHPVSAPRNPSVIERLLKVCRPWPVSRNPVYARPTIQKIARTLMGPHIVGGISNIVAKFLLVSVEDVCQGRKTAWLGMASRPWRAIVDVNGDYTN